MNIATKFDMWQRLFAIEHQTLRRPPVTCEACEGQKKVTLRGESYDCPKCRGAGEVRHEVSGCVVGMASSVGHIRATRETVGEHTHFDIWEDEADLGVERTVVEYMLVGSGVGSGRVWREHDLRATREEAQAECDRRNGWQVSP